MGDHIENIIDINFAKKTLPKRPIDSNKGTFGKILNVAGSKFYQGAAVLSSLAALRTGAGYVTLACCDCILDNIASQSPDITFIPLFSCNGSIDKSNAEFISNKTKYHNVISIGCGLSQNQSTVDFVKEVVEATDQQTNVVIDADGLNAISKFANIALPYNTIITPHPKELSRLMRIDLDEILKKRNFYAIKTAKKYGCIVVLKGHKTIITDGKDLFINTTGNSSLAKAGSGDILTGIISGLLAQGVTLLNAAKLGVFIHGLTGELAAKDLTEYGVLASDLLKYIPLAIKNIIE